MPIDRYRTTRRRQVLRALAAGAGVAALAPGARSWATPGAARPRPAVRAGYNRLAFYDNFSSTKSIDIRGTNRPGYKWYTTEWFDAPDISPDNIAVSNSVLTLGGGTSEIVWGLHSAIASPEPPYYTGTVFSGGAYFEARIAFDPAQGANATAWPAWWSIAIEHIYSEENPTDGQWPGQEPGYVHFAELDFMEAYHAPNESYVGKTSFLSAIHDWSGHKPSPSGPPEHNIFNANCFVDVGPVDWNEFHTYGTLWVPQRRHSPGYVQRFFDGRPVQINYWRGPVTDPPLPGQGDPNTLTVVDADTPGEATETFAIMDLQRHALSISTDKNWPMRVDWVKVWQ